MHKPAATQQEFLTVKEFAAIRRVSEDTVYRWKKDGSIKFVKSPGPNGKILIPASEAQA